MEYQFEESSADFEPLETDVKTLIKSENEVDITDFDLNNLDNYVILSFASNEKMKEYRREKGYSFCNPFTCLVFAYFKLVADKYIHVEISFRTRQATDKFVTFTVSNDSKVVKVLTRQFDEFYSNFTFSVNDDQKKTIFEFLKARVEMPFDRIGSFRMPFFPEKNYEKKGRKSYYCVPLVILALQSIGLMKTLPCNCVSIDELLEIVKANDTTYLHTLAPIVFRTDCIKSLKPTYFDLNKIKKGD